MKAPLPRLEALLATESLPPRAAKRCAHLVERLRAPVRIGLFGFPGAGKSAVLHALAKGAVFAAGHLTTPCLLRYAERGEVTLTDPEGNSVTEAAKMPVKLPQDAVFAEVTLALASLRKMSLLCVVADSDPVDMASAMRWATPRCDIAIWCSRDWTLNEQHIWHGAPERLKDHAFVVRSGPKAPPLTALDDGPEQIHCPTLKGAEGEALLVPSGDVLRAHLDKIIAEARAEDIDAAHVFLAQYDADPTPETPAFQTKPDTPSPTPPSRPKATPQARAVLDRLFLQTRQGARDLAAQFQNPVLRDDQAAEALPQVQEVLETLLETAEADSAFSEAWPELTDTLRDAGELSLLMGLEGGAAGLEDAAVLLAQIRQDMECALAA
ncbi:hypothetical protein [Pacificoceanicola onchidii]|uniref:hypothetical protein n=1 Tax=Pacificoceanicola onchidii TaxID=2562685 RepID=UPI0010A3A64A|nr:hypothetical protein [Pacificoceanicola onchidii]